MSAFTPPVLPSAASRHAQHQKARQRKVTTTAQLTRRAALQTVLLSLFPATVHAMGRAPLAETLTGVVRIRDALEELSNGEADALAGARDLRRTLSTLLRGSALRADAASAAGMLSDKLASRDVTKHVDNAREYIDLATGYFDERSGALTGNERAFAMKALAEALKELDLALVHFDDDIVAQARAILVGAV